MVLLLRCHHRLIDSDFFVTPSLSLDSYVKLIKRLRLTTENISLTTYKVEIFFPFATPQKHYLKCIDLKFSRGTKF